MRCISSAVVLSFFVSACGSDGGGDLTEPTIGAIEITTTTSGGTDAAGYTVSLDGAIVVPIGRNAALTHSEVATGPHVVQLAGLPEGCSVEGENPRGVSVTAGETATVTFAITCVLPVGAVRVTTATSGPAPDGNGYMITIDGADHGALGVTEAVSISGLLPGSHVVGLADVAANCQIEGENLRPVTITAGAEANITYTIVCAPPPPGAGSAKITTTTSGPDSDADGYTFAVDGGTSQPIAPNGTTTLTNLAPGVHSIQLAGVAGNCTVQGPNPQSVTVTAAATADLSFAISCSAITGSIRVSVTSSGTPTDPDGYVAKLDGADSGRSIGIVGNVIFTSVPAGSHTVALTGLAANCSATGGPLQNTTVTVGVTSELSFVVTCTTTTGSIHVTTLTTGSSLDPDGYTVSIDGGASQAIGVNATLTVGGLSVGTRAITLSGIASNCHLDGDNPRTVEALPGSTTVTFELNCLGANALIAFGSNAFQLQAIFIVNHDGTGLRNLTPADAREHNPVWSPDGRRIIFGGDDGLSVMNADGMGRLNLAGRDALQYRWSPEGRMIAFVRERIDGENFFYDLWVMGADGSGKIQLAANATDPSWSPDNRRIAFGTFDGQINLINADGSGATKLTNSRFGAFPPAWSPDGTRIAFAATVEDIQVGVGDKQIFLINPDGSGLVNLSQGRGDDDSPTWSPDGSKIAFVVGEEGNLGSEVAVMNRDGSGRTNLTNRPGFDVGADWSPDGGKIVYYRSEGADSEIYVMNADGTGQINVSNRPDTDESAPDWGGQGSTAIASRQSVLYKSWLRAHGLEASGSH